MKSKFTNDEVNAVMESRGINRKSAVKFLSRQAKVSKRGTKGTGPAAAVAPAKVADVKMAAANDKPEAVTSTSARIKALKKEAEPTKLLTPEERGAARKEGLRLFVLAGKPKKQDFVRVFGKKGPAWTWEARAKAVGLDSAEACAAKFQSLLKKA